jgi:hypothetical protein
MQSISELMSWKWIPHNQQGGFKTTAMIFDYLGEFRIEYKLHIMLLSHALKLVVA